MINKNLKKILLIIGIFYSVNAFSGLAPFYHSAKEFEDLLADPNLVQILGVGSFVTEIKKEKNQIVLKTKYCSLIIHSKIINPDIPEAPKFKFSYENLKCER